VWDVAAGVEVACLRGRAGAVGWVAFGPDEGQVRAVGSDRAVYVWRIHDKALLSHLPATGSEGKSMAFSPDGKHAFSLSAERTVKVWDANGRVCLEEIPGPNASGPALGEGPVQSLEVVTDGFEMMIRSGGGQPLAWFPESLGSQAKQWYSALLAPAPSYQTTTHPADRVWAGALGNHVYLIRLEGDLSALR
jgi:hypothetical protein